MLGLLEISKKERMIIAHIAEKVRRGHKGPLRQLLASRKKRTADRSSAEIF